eukprot:TRINITY_DN2368_c0_g1_i3.p1 TRINITY_DN2368_c0_g1~~TRINITY_DN2368_c0_g1_i3.p1  ORF type:complete len:325 (+),score=42.84 TRINITY_DN2368_c0_g1_i3:382-1356(+)
MRGLQSDECDAAGRSQPRSHGGGVTDMSWVHQGSRGQTGSIGSIGAESLQNYSHGSKAGEPRRRSGSPPTPTWLQESNFRSKGSHHLSEENQFGRPETAHADQQRSQGNRSNEMAGSRQGSRFQVAGSSNFDADGSKPQESRPRSRSPTASWLRDSNFQSKGIDRPSEDNRLGASTMPSMRSDRSEDAFLGHARSHGGGVTDMSWVHQGSRGQTGSGGNIGADSEQTYSHGSKPGEPRRRSGSAPAPSWLRDDNFRSKGPDHPSEDHRLGASSMRGLQSDECDAAGRSQPRSRGGGVTDMSWVHQGSRGQTGSGGSIGADSLQN